MMLATSVASADGTMTSTTGEGTCTGTIGTKMFSGKTMLAIGKDPSQRLTILAQRASTVFGKAECECRSRDIYLRVNLDSAGLAPKADNPGMAMYIGDDICSDEKQRVGQVKCDKISATNPPKNQSFSLDYTPFTNLGYIDTIIPAEALSIPKPVSETGVWPYNCEGITQQNYTAQILIGPSASPATCKLPLTVKTQPPTAPTLDSIASGDGALTVNWSVPETTSGIEYYQVLCRKRSQPTVPPKSSDWVNETKYYFSSCIGGTLYRRAFAGLTDTTVIPPPDGGTTSPADMLADTVDLAGVDLAGADLSSPADLLPAPSSDEFPVDPRFICSAPVTAAATSLNTRIDGLQNQEEYDIMVVSIDPYGNAAPSKIQRGTPQPTDHPLGLFCSGADCPSGFGCQAAPVEPSTVASFGAAGLVAAGALLGLALRSRRRRSADGSAS